MKKIHAILSIYLLFFSFACSTNEPNVCDNDFGIDIRVDPTVELFCTIYRLAGIDQYTVNDLPKYISDIKEYFIPFRDHPTIKLAIDLREENRINGSAPMALAVYLDTPPVLKGRNTLNPPPSDLDPRWSKDIIPEFIEAARKFSRDTNFMEFFNSHQEFYNQCVQNLTKNLKRKNLVSWFQNYFGYKSEKYTIIIGMQTGYGNYGLKITQKDSSREFISIIGASTPWWRNTPGFSENWIIPTVVHEFCHSYINPLVAEYNEELKEVGQNLYPSHQPKLQSQGYIDYKIMFDEYLVRACTIRYLNEKKKYWQIERQIKNDKNRGFPAIRDLVNIFEKYEKNRNTYNTLTDFMPEILNYFYKYARSIE